LRDAISTTTRCHPMGEQREHRAPVHVHPTLTSELSTRTPPMVRFSGPEDGLTTSATRTDARAQATGVSHSSVIEATFLLDRVRPFHSPCGE